MFFNLVNKYFHQQFKAKTLNFVHHIPDMHNIRPVGHLWPAAGFNFALEVQNLVFSMLLLQKTPFLYVCVKTYMCYGPWTCKNIFYPGIKWDRIMTISISDWFKMTKYCKEQVMFVYWKWSLKMRLALMFWVFALQGEQGICKSDEKCKLLRYIIFISILKVCKHKMKTKTEKLFWSFWDKTI